jgi:cytidyltransferase-like protein
MNSLVKELIQPLLEEVTKTIALYPGKFKPPHKGHFEVAKSLLNKADQVTVVISPVPVDGITPQQSKAIWELYNTLLDNKLTIVITDKSPVKYVLDTIKENPNDKFIAAFGKGEEDRYKSLIGKPNVEIYDGGTVGELNARDLRKLLQSNQNISRFLPAGISQEDFTKTFSTVNENCGCQHSQQPTDFKSALASLTKYMLNQDYNIEPLPKLKIVNNDVKNAENILGKTAYYDPTNCSITLYTLNRHPKDVLRSYAHEMIHRIQDNEGRLKNINTTNTNEDGNLEELEKEAYLKGNMTFRNWEDSIKNPINEWIVDIPKFNYPKTIYENLWYTLNEITLNPNNAVEIYGDLSKGKFQIGDDVYVYDIKQVKNPYDDEGRFFNIMFHPKDDAVDIPTGTSNKENYIKILNTIYKIILDFAKEVEPEYIGISSMDNNRSKNYHRIYANLTDNKYNRIPGYFRKDVSLEFNTPKGKGRFIVLKRKDV